LVDIEHIPALLKRSKHPFAAISQDFSLIMGTVLTNWKEEIKIQKRKVDTLADFKSIWQLQKLLMLSGWALIKST
jgi:hypothetical protein